jgi:hypothetical protein
MRPFTWLVIAAVVVGSLSWRCRGTEGNELCIGEPTIIPIPLATPPREHDWPKGCTLMCEDETLAQIRSEIRTEADAARIEAKEQILKILREQGVLPRETVATDYQTIPGHITFVGTASGSDPDVLVESRPEQTIAGHATYYEGPIEELTKGTQKLEL